MIDFLKDDTKPDEPTMYENLLRSTTPILLTNETIIRVFRSRCYRVIYTNKRCILIDVRWLTRKNVQVEYLSVPNQWFQSFAIETCGAIFNKEAKVYLHTECSLGNIKQDISVKYFDIMKMHKMLSDFLLFDATST
jgi:Bacterial PH domain